VSDSKAPMVFVPARSSKTEVILNWIGTPDERFEFYTEPFLQAGRILAGRYDGTGLDRDFAAFPVVFLYRQALELYLKVGALRDPGLHRGCASVWGQRERQAPGFMKATRMATMASRPGSLQIIPPCLQRRPTSRLLALSTAALARG